MPEASPQILSVDDDKSIRDLIKVKLEKYGYKCHSVSGGEAAIELLKSVDVDIALLDIFMPVMTGLSLFQAIKELAPEVGVVFVTSVDDMDLAFSCFRNGALDYVMKSKIQYRLAPAVEHALERRAAILGKDRRLSQLENLLKVQAEVIDSKSREISALNQLIHGSLKPLMNGENLDATGAGEWQAGSGDDAQFQDDTQ